MQCNDKEIEGVKKEYFYRHSLSRDIGFGLVCNDEEMKPWFANSKALTGTTNWDRYQEYLIQDEGIGMDSSEVVHIFERFYRSDEARNENTGGSGLGLSIAKWIVDAHEGTIDVLSRPDFGTRFTVSFPAVSSCSS